MISFTSSVLLRSFVLVPRWVASLWFDAHRMRCNAVRRCKWNFAKKKERKTDGEKENKMNYIASCTARSAA